MLNDIPVVSLVDSGADVSCISLNLAQKVANYDHRLRLSKNGEINGVGGIPIKVIGEIKLSLDIGGVAMSQNFLVIEQLSYPLILGVDFLTNYDCQIDFSTKTLYVQDKLISIPLTNELYTVPVETLCEINIPPRSDSVIPVFIDSNVSIGMIENNEVNTSNLLVARAIVNVKGCKTLCTIQNPTENNIKLDKGFRIAQFSEVDILENEEGSQTSRQIASIETSQVRITLEEARQIISNLKIDLSDSDLDDNDKNKLIIFLAQNKDMFATDMSQLGVTDLITHHIDTGSSKPIKQRPYRTSPIMNKEIESQVHDMLENKIIAPSTSPWASPVVMIKKKLQPGELKPKFRFACDFRKLNQVSVPMHFPLPRLEDALDIMGDLNYFSRLDVFSAYWQIMLDESSQDKTTFTTHCGNFKFLRLPFGLQSSPACFQSLMNSCLAGLTFKTCLVFIDDILCLSKTFEEHLSNLSDVFHRLRVANLKLKPNKCSFVTKRVKYLGHIISKHGVQVD